MTPQTIIEETDPDVVAWAEDRVVRRLGPLTRSTTPEQWDAYWQAVADEIRSVPDQAGR